MLALDPSRSLTQYFHRVWQIQPGLPQASIYCVLQTQDAYLWLGTQLGLVRFDGVRFSILPRRLAAPTVYHPMSFGV